MTTEPSTRRDDARVAALRTSWREAADGPPARRTPRAGRPHRPTTAHA